MMDINLISLIQETKHGKRNYVLLMLVVLFAIVILGFQFQKRTEQLDRTSLVTTNSESVLEQIQVDQSAAIKPLINKDKCLEAQQDLKLIGSIIDEFTTVAFFKHMSSEKVISFTNKRQKTRSTTNGTLHQATTERLSLGWKGCLLEFAF